MDGIDELPPCMRIYYKALCDVYVEMENEMGKLGKSYAVEYGKAEVWISFSPYGRICTFVIHFRLD